MQDPILDLKWMYLLMLLFNNVTYTHKLEINNDYKKQVVDNMVKIFIYLP